MMRINDKTLGEIFRLLPWTYKAVIVAGVLFLCITAAWFPYITYKMKMADVEKPEALSVFSLPGSGRVEMLDPSIVFDGENHVAAFTVIRTETPDALRYRPSEIAIADSKNDCKSWVYATTALKPRPDELMGPDGTTPITVGVWRVETPTIVHDPEDKERPWKLYAYRYFWSGDVAIARLYGVIVESGAQQPEGPWEQEKWLFTAMPETPPYPYNGLARAYLNGLHPDLAQGYFYARPSVIRHGGVLFMSLSMFVRGMETPARIVMLASMDHGATWQYIGTPLRHEDLSRMGDYTTLAGASLILKDGQPLLAAVLGNAASEGLGTFIFSFDSLIKGQLQADTATGAPAIRKFIPRSSLSPSERGGGFAAYEDSCRHGLLTSEYSGLRQQFHLFKTYTQPLP